MCTYDVYKILNENFGLKCLSERRLKLSRVNELNDPFELRPYDISCPNRRRVFLETRDDMHSNMGLVCFSSGWSNPVIWAHYSDNHKGLCLGLEIQTEEVANNECEKVRYIKKTLPFPIDYSNLPDRARHKIVQRILFTKYEHWKYENEIRLWGSLQNEENGLYFFNFGRNLQVREVIVGAKCTLSRQEIARAIGPLTSSVEIIKTRAAHDQFKMVRDEDWE